MRGKAVCPCFFQLGDGITPAYAGKSSEIPPSSLPSWDHPRLCGEKFALIVLPSIVMGSPPPMRGKAMPQNISK